MPRRASRVRAAAFHRPNTRTSRRTRSRRARGSLRNFLPVREKLLQADVRERMLRELQENRERTCRDVRAHPSCLLYVHRVTNRRDEDLGRELVMTIDVEDLADELHAIGRNVVEAAHE